MKAWLIDKTASLVIYLLAPFVVIALGLFYLYEKATGKNTAL